MKNYILKIVLLCAFFVFYSCETKKSKPKIPPYKAGVVISFDDAYVNEWFDADKVLKKYKWKATFCVSKINTLNESEIAKLQQLQSEGHEIAGHGFHHYNAVKFIAQFGTKEYVKQEIEPMLVLMKSYSLHVSSFAYPEGERSPALDGVLLDNFKILRGRSFGGEIPSKQSCFFKNSKIEFGFDIDNNHIHFSIPYLVKLLNYARKNKKILILSSHKPVDSLTANYQTKVETLEFICKYMKQNNMKFYTLSDLNKFK